MPDGIDNELRSGESQETKSPEWMDERVCDELEGMGLVFIGNSLPECLIGEMGNYTIVLSPEYIEVNKAEIMAVSTPNPLVKQPTPEEDLEAIKKVIAFREVLIPEGYDVLQHGADTDCYAMCMRKAFVGTFKTDAVKEVGKLQIALKSLNSSNE